MRVLLSAIALSTQLPCTSCIRVVKTAEDRAQEAAEAKDSQVTTYWQGSMAMAKTTGHFSNHWAAQGSCTADEDCLGVVSKNIYYGPWQKAVVGGDSLVQGLKKKIKKWFGIWVGDKSPAVFVVDKSGSMDAKFKNTTRDAATFDELTKTLNGLEPWTLFNVITFHKDVFKVFDSVKYASPENVQAALQAVKDTKTELCRVCTDTKKALTAVLTGNDVTASGEIFFLSDGRPTPPGPQASLNTAAALDGGRKLKINTVLLGSDNKIATDFMEQLAEQTGGVYKKV